MGALVTNNVERLIQYDRVSFNLWFLLFVKAFLAITPNISIYRHFFVLLSPAILGFSFRVLRKKASFA
jgi:hypothetical protein